LPLCRQTQRGISYLFAYRQQYGVKGCNGISVKKVILASQRASVAGLDEQ
jgi:hypothetical protein